MSARVPEFEENKVWIKGILNQEPLTSKWNNRNIVNIRKYKESKTNIQIVRTNNDENEIQKIEAKLNTKNMGDIITFLKSMINSRTRIAKISPVKSFKAESNKKTNCINNMKHSIARPSTVMDEDLNALCAEPKKDANKNIKVKWYDKQRKFFFNKYYRKNFVIKSSTRQKNDNIIRHLLRNCIKDIKKKSMKINIINDNKI